jgi:ABC-type Fe3+ transport system substrate-binding protein
VDTLLIVAVIACASIIALPFVIPRPPPEVTLRILSRDDVVIQNVIEESFLSSTYAEMYNIVDIRWVSFDSGVSIGGGYSDLLMVPVETASAYNPLGFWKHLNSSVVLGVNETIAGVPMKGYHGGHIVWCTYSFYIIIFELLVNTTLLQDHGLTVPETVDDLLSHQFNVNGANSSLIGFDIPEPAFDDHLFQHHLTKSLGWESGIQKLTALYANSKAYERQGDAEEALRNGEIAVTLSTFTGQAHDPLPATLSRTHLENQVSIVPDVVCIDNETEHPRESEAFVEYLLSPECQSIILHDAGSRMPIRREAFDILPALIDDSIYSEFNWTARTNGPGVDSMLDVEDFALWYYMNSTAFSARSNLTNCWENVYEAFDNGSITLNQFEYFKNRMGESLTIIDPITLNNETFTEYYASGMMDDLFWIYYEQEVSLRWKVAANQRYHIILEELSLLL